MLPTITDLTKGVPANDPSEDWVKASEDAQKLSVFYKKLANDQTNAYEKTVNRIMANHNGHGKPYRAPANDKFIRQNIANDKVDAYAKTLDRIMQRHNGHDNAPGRMDADNENRIIHDYNPHIPQSMRELQLTPKDEIHTSERLEGFTGADTRTDTDLLKSIDNTTTNILETLHRISYAIEDSSDVDSLRARERDLETGHGISHESLKDILEGLSGAKKDSKETKPGSFWDTLNGTTEAAKGLAFDGIAIPIAAAGAIMTGAGEVYNRVTGHQQEKVGGGHSGQRQAPKQKADSPTRKGGEAPPETHVQIVSQDGVTPRMPKRTGTKRSQELQLMVYDAFRKQGYTEEAAKTMVAEVGRENGFNENIIFGSHIDPYNKKTNVGMLSWQKERGSKLAEQLTKAGLMKNGKMVHSQETIDFMAKYFDDEISKSNMQMHKNVRDKSKHYQELEEDIGRHAIKWRHDDPKYSVKGHRNQIMFFDSITKIVDKLGDTVDRLNKKVDYQNQIPLNKVKRNDDREVIKALRASNGRQVRLPDGNVAGTGSVTINLPPAHQASPATEARVKAREQQAKRRPPPPRSGLWDEWKSYFGL
jgi:hypothetical protein